MTAHQKSHLDIHQTVTDKIIKPIEADIDHWQMPWHRPGTNFSILKNALTGNPYRGINVLSPWIDADTKKFEHQVWATYKQFQELGAQVSAGEKASLIVKYGDWTPKTDEAGTPDKETGDELEKRMYAKPAWLFNVAQVDGHALPDAAPRVDLTERLAHVDAFVGNTRIEIREGGQRAFYRRPRWRRRLRAAAAAEFLHGHRDLDADRKLRSDPAARDPARKRGAPPARQKF